jgi:hypothetical protein
MFTFLQTVTRRSRIVTITGLTLDQGPLGAAGPSPPPHAHPSMRSSPSTSHDYDPEDRAGPAL